MSALNSDKIKQITASHAKMGAIKEDRRRIVGKFWLQNKERGKPFVRLRFEMMAMKRRTVFKYIKFAKKGHSPS